VTRSSADSAEKTLLRSADKLDDDLFLYAASKAKVANTDLTLVWTLMVVENLQRPACFALWKGVVLACYRSGLLVSCKYEVSKS
jgi:hypothetical protein